MPLTKDQILAALPGLPPDTLRAIRAACGTLLGGDPATGKGGQQTALAWLFEAYASALGVRLGYAKFSGTAPGRQFSKNAPAALAFVATAFGPAMARKPMALGVMRFLFGLLLQDMHAKKIPVTVGTVATHLPRMEKVFRNEFPGYLESGITSFILDQLVTGEK